MPVCSAQHLEIGAAENTLYRVQLQDRATGRRHPGLRPFCARRWRQRAQELGSVAATPPPPPRPPAAHLHAAVDGGDRRDAVVLVGAQQAAEAADELLVPLTEEAERVPVVLADLGLRVPGEL